MANLLPLLLIGGAATAVVVAGGKKNGKKGKVNKGTYSYTRNCVQFWIGKHVVKEKMQVTPQLNEAIKAFAAQDAIPAIKQAYQEIGDSPVPFLEASVVAGAKLMPECKLEEGKPASKAMLEVLPLLMNWAVQVYPGTLLGSEFAREMMLLATAPGAGTKKIDLMALIRKEREKAAAGG